MKSVYIHIPFCKNICNYCDFCKMYYHEKIVDQYLEALEKEVKNGYQKEKIKTIYIGGGTPSCLSVKQLEKLFRITSLFDKEKDLEFTFECNFDSIDKKKLEAIKKGGVNRLSFGIETFHETYLKEIGRNLSYEEARNKIEEARKLGFKNINVDLMYGFHNESIKEVQEDLDKILSLDVDHISTYSLMIEEHTKFYIEKYENVEEDLDSDMYYFIISYLEKHGFKQYEISNFAKGNRKSLHNLTYWNNERYYGFGLGSSGYVGKIRYTNTKSLNKYLNQEYKKEEEIVEKEEEMIYEMILGLRKRKGVSKKRFQEKFGLTCTERFDIMKLVEDKNLIEEEEYIYIPLEKLYVSNSILIYFLEGVKDE